MNRRDKRIIREELPELNRRMKKHKYKEVKPRSGSGLYNATANFYNGIVNGLKSFDKFLGSK